MCNFSSEEKDYMPYKVDGYGDLKVNFESSKVLCILDDCRHLLDHPKKLTVFLCMFSLKLRKIVQMY
jgi:hypothetical protein